MVSTKAIIEALLFIAEEPLTIKDIQAVLPEADENTIHTLLIELQNEYNLNERGLRIIELANGYRMCTRAEVADFLAKFKQVKTETKLTKAALETLAIIAYQQPITRAEIEYIRGVDSSGVLHSLLEKKFIKIVGRKETLGRPILYGTTDQFLDRFGLKNLEELPKLNEIKNSTENEKI